MCLVFIETDAEAAGPASSGEVKFEVAAAYNAVGQTAHLPGNKCGAHAIMKLLGYTQEQIGIAAAHAADFQGVGNPHRLAALQQGETVLDIGCGLGIDSFIAAHAVGESGRVVGVDIAYRQVQHATSRAAERGLHNVRFEVADIERMPFPNAFVDVVISNGAFCLTPDKRAAFREVARVLKPGGRFSICTSLIRNPLESGVEWPLCIGSFAEVSIVVPACEAAGLINVSIDDSDSLMVFEVPDAGGESGDSPEQEGPCGDSGRHRVHSSSSKFQHLGSYDMNQLCLRVIITGQKPV
jgi:SAM-dependent methyltransferase